MIKKLELDDLERKDSPFKLLLALMVSILICELAVKYLFLFLPVLNSPNITFIDLIIFVVILSLALYLFFYRPLVMHFGKLKEIEALQRELALVDELTGLYNRRGLLLYANHLLALSNRTQRGLIFIYADLDGLKRINDGFGHVEGDKALTCIAKVLRKTFRRSDVTGALGSTFIAAKYWESFAIGAALVGFPIVIGENVVGIDKNAVIEKGKIKKAPELDRRIETYLKYYDGYGSIIVQMNVEDTRNGVAEYVIEKYGDKVVIELKWGQGAKDIGGEIQVNDLDYAVFLKRRGYVVDPDPTLPEVQSAFKAGAIKTIARHSRLGYTDLDSSEQVEKNFMNAVKHLRKIGYKRISLKTGSYGMEALAMSIKFATDAKLDLLTIDGSGGGTGMSPWNMMETWGVPSIFLHSKAHEYAALLAKKGKKVVDMALAGGLAREDHIFKALALGAPFTKLVCMGRAVMIPGFLGSNIEGVLNPDRKDKICGHWEKLPNNVTESGANSPAEIFAGYYDVEKKVGKSEMKNIPYGAIAVWTLADKLAAGLQQFMAGARKFSLSSISRDDLYSGNRQTEAETGIPFITDVGDKKAKKILCA